VLVVLLHMDQELPILDIVEDLHLLDQSLPRVVEEVGDLMSLVLPVDLVEEVLKMILEEHNQEVRQQIIRDQHNKDSLEEVLHQVRLLLLVIVQDLVVEELEVLVDLQKELLHQEQILVETVE